VRSFPAWAYLAQESRDLPLSHAMKDRAFKTERRTSDTGQAPL
jgi:hypothetical protein